MFLKNLKVKNFRVLKNVELNFEPEYKPTIYPLGSLNGGGKSTLLQLVFVLLHCSFDKERHSYLVNMFSGLKNDYKDCLELLNTEITLDDSEYFLDFYIVKNNYMGLDFDVLLDLDEIYEEVKDAKRIDKHYSELANIREEIIETGRISALIEKKLHIYTSHTNRLVVHRSYSAPNKVEYYIDIIEDLLKEYQEKIIKNDSVAKIMKENLAIKEKLENKLSTHNFSYITHINSDDILLYKTDANQNILQEIPAHVYLAAPNTQVFLFLSAEEKNKLFLSTNSNFGRYSDAVDKAKKDLNGLFTYDFASTDFITHAFKKARNKDFEIALKSGNYGNNLKQLKYDLSNFLLGKSINIDKDLSRIIFKLIDSEKELLPEDLSHGELKKLGIYIWLKSCDMQDSLILMDEIEIGLHPDWQYEIVNDLQKWSKNNQFILATHSYELCQALTPAHVKELEPQLISSTKD